MKWKRIPKESSIQPRSGTYQDWKPYLAEEGFHQCVYCAIHEVSFGGINNFHVEHFRPKSKFPDLRTDIKNLYYACPICNVFKGNDWPREPVAPFAEPCFPPPCDVDYNDLFSVDWSNGEVASSSVAGRYLVEKVNLNRIQLRYERRAWRVYEEMVAFVELAKRCVDELFDGDGQALAKDVTHVLAEAMELLLEHHRQGVPYDHQDTGRPSK